MKMEPKVLIINYYFPPIINGGVQRTYNFKKFLSQMGFGVDFLTTSSYGVLENDVENGIIRFPDKGYDYTHSSKNLKLGIMLFRAFRLAQVKLGLITDGKFYWKREVLMEIDKIISKGKYDVIIASYPTPANLEIGELIHKKYGIPLMVDYRDGLMYEPFTSIDKCSFIFRKRLLSLEKRMAHSAALHITVNPDMNKYYSDAYPNVRSIIIPNGFDTEEIIDVPPIKLPDGINVCYTGAIGKSRVLYTDDELKSFLSYMFEVAPNINFNFIGDYTQYEREIFKKYQNAFVYEKTERKTIIATQRIADALLLISGPHGITSGKLYEYLFANKPILNIGGHQGIASIIDDRYYGTTCTPDERSKINHFLEALSNGKLSFERGDLSKYTRRYQGEMLAKEIRQIVSSNLKTET